MGTTIRHRVRVAGRVQGVWFRDTCRRVAEDHGVAGWVRNLPDGRVEAVLEGDRGAVAAVVEWCRVGPRHAVVTGVEVVDEQPRGMTAFEVRR